MSALCAKFIFHQCTCCSDTNISQGSVATYLSCGGIFDEMMALGALVVSTDMLRHLTNCRIIIIIITAIS